MGGNAYAEKENDMKKTSPTGTSRRKTNKAKKAGGLAMD